MQRENWVGVRPKVILPEKSDSQKRRKENRRLEREIKKDWDNEELDLNEEEIND